MSSESSSLAAGEVGLWEMRKGRGESSRSGGLSAMLAFGLDPGMRPVEFDESDIVR